MLFEKQQALIVKGGQSERVSRPKSVFEIAGCAAKIVSRLVVLTGFEIA